MVLARIYYYLSAVTLLACAAASCITVVPEGEYLMGLILVTLLVSSGLFALVGFWPSRRYSRNPDWWIFVGKRPTVASLGLAIVVTLPIVLGVLG